MSDIEETGADEHALSPDTVSGVPMDGEHDSLHNEDAGPAQVEDVPLPEAPSPIVVELVAPVTAKGKLAADGESWFETVKTIVYALLIALVIRTLFFQPFNIPSASMEGTLLIGDYLFVEKFAYGYSRFSMPFGHIFPTFGRILGTGPDRGDVVVFKMPNENSADYMQDFIKRVIGLPGDRVQMIDDRLYINDKVVPRVRVADYIEKVDSYENHVAQYRETLPNGKSYLTLDREVAGPYDNTPVFVVPPGHYFMMGDNRDNSDDSRAEVGYVPAENIEGKAEFRFFSIDESAAWWQLWKWPWAVRYSRLFSGID